MNNKVVKKYSIFDFPKKRERELRSARKQKMKKNSIRKSNRHIAKYDPESAMTSTVPRKVLLVLDKCLCFRIDLGRHPCSCADVRLSLFRFRVDNV